MRFRVSSILTPSDAPGVAVPVFVMDGSNLPFVQEMDQYYTVVDMMPFLNSEYYEMTADSGGEHYVQIGEPGLIAFRDLNRRIKVMGLSEIFEYRDKYAVQLQDAPLLNLQLARACGVPRAAMHDMWRMVAASYFPEAERDSWIDAEHQLSQRDSAIWAAIKDAPDSDLQFDDIPGDLSFERLFAWLNTNRHHPKWGRVWIRAFQKRPFDERMMQLGADWSESRIAASAPVAEVKAVLYLFLEGTESRSISEEFSIILREYITEKGAEFYDFYYPSGFLFHFVRNSYVTDEEARRARKSEYVDFLMSKTEHNERLRGEVESALKIKLLRSFLP